MAHISTPSLLQYGLIAIPVAFAGFPLYILGPDYYATQHGVSLTLLAALLLVIRSFDAIQDPLFGWLIDRKRTWLMPVSAIAAIVLCLAITGLFNFVVYSPPVWFAICMFFAVTAYSLLTITMGAVGTLWTADHTAQTRIASAREGSALVGLIVAVSLPGVFAAVFTTDAATSWIAKRSTANRFSHDSCSRSPARTRSRSCSRFRRTTARRGKRTGYRRLRASREARRGLYS